MEVVYLERAKKPAHTVIERFVTTVRSNNGSPTLGLRSYTSIVRVFWSSCLTRITSSDLGIGSGFLRRGPQPPSQQGLPRAGKLGALVAAPYGVTHAHFAVVSRRPLAI